MAEDSLTLVDTLRRTLVQRATSTTGDDPTYTRVRALVLREPRFAAVAPPWLKTCRDLTDFWGLIQPKFPSYGERRVWIQEQLEPLFAVAEARTTAPAEALVSDLLKKSGSDYVNETWQKAIARREQDPDGAITAARTLLEEVCRFVLDEESVTYDEKAELPKLYGLVAHKLKLAPSQHSEEAVKRVLGGCHSIVEGIGSLRSKMGDAHAKGKKGARATPRHAGFAVLVAGAAAGFIIETYQDRKKRGTL